MTISTMHWIWQNKEWLFSGVAVTCLAGFLSFLFRRRIAPTSENLSAVQADSLIASPVATGSNISQTVSITVVGPTPAEIVPAEYSAKPTPQEIFSQIRDLPPYQRESAAKNYVGLRVRWLTHFASIHRHLWRDDAHWVLLYPSGGRRCLDISVEVDIEQYPRLKSLREGSQIEVCGIIEEVNDIFIKIENATFSFVE